jgi:TonB family protein
MAMTFAFLSSLLLHSALLIGKFHQPHAKNHLVVAPIKRPLYASVQNIKPHLTELKHQHSSVKRASVGTNSVANIQDTVATGASAINKNSGVNTHPPLLLVWRNWLETNVLYPDRSRQLAEEGEVQIQLVFDQSGALKHWDIVQASPYWRLNQAVKNALANLPPHLGQTIHDKELKLTMTLQFSVNQTGPAAKDKD